MSSPGPRLPLRVAALQATLDDSSRERSDEGESLGVVCVCRGGGGVRGGHEAGARGRNGVKPVICRAVADARGKSAQELAQALERDAIKLAPSGYVLAGLLPGDPLVASYRHEGAPPRPGAR